MSVGPGAEDIDIGVVDHGRGSIEFVHRHGASILLVLSITGLIVQALAISVTKPQPRYDEVAYTAVARAAARITTA